MLCRLIKKFVCYPDQTNRQKKCECPLGNLKPFYMPVSIRLCNKSEVMLKTVAFIAGKSENPAANFFLFFFPLII